MKLRIKGSSLRLRLTQGEVQQLADSGNVEEQVQFANARLTYRVRRDAAARDIAAAYDGNTIEIRVPEQVAREWSRNEQVTLAHSQSVPGTELRIVIEKDFACLAPREGEDESDNFPHPEASSGKTC
jgi:hypothetical protein